MRSLCAAAFLALAALSPAQRLFYPEGLPVPRYMTPAEQAYVDLYGFPSADLNEPPKGQVRCPAEYEPMEGIIVSWEAGETFYTFLLGLIRGVTSAQGAGMVYISVDSTSEQSTVTSRLIAEGIDLSKIKFVVTPTDTVWMRDYGPRYIYQGGVRTIVDHIYNRPRPLDNNFPFAFSALKKHQIYSMDLVHGGGNFHLDARNNGFATRLINSENPSKTETEIIGLWRDYQNLETTLFNQFPTSVDLTGHLDMWMQVVSDNTVVISTWPNAQGSTQAQICDSAAAHMQSRGFTVLRVPAFVVNGVHYTYTNVVMCNGVVIIPTYTNSSVSPSNAAALATWQAAAPGKQIIQVNAQGIIPSAGAMHCVVMHVPRPLNGSIPSAYLTNVNTRQVFRFGQSYPLEWVSDDDQGVTHVDLQLRTITGKWLTIASNQPPNGQFQWTVPAMKNSSALLRVRAYDANGNVGIDESDAEHVISP